MGRVHDYRTARGVAQLEHRNYDIRLTMQFESFPIIAGHSARAGACRPRRTHVSYGNYQNFHHGFRFVAAGFLRAKSLSTANAASIVC